MASDTGPSELSKIIGSDESFRLYMVQKMERIDGRIELVVANQERHERDDERRFNQLELKVGGATSSADDNEKEIANATGISKGVLITCALVAWFITTGIALAALFVK